MKPKPARATTTTSLDRATALEPGHLRACFARWYHRLEELARCRLTAPIDLAPPQPVMVRQAVGRDVPGRRRPGRQVR